MPRRYYQSSDNKNRIRSGDLKTPLTVYVMRETREQLDILSEKYQLSFGALLDMLINKEFKGSCSDIKMDSVVREISEEEYRLLEEELIASYQENGEIK